MSLEAQGEYELNTLYREAIDALREARQMIPRGLIDCNGGKCRQRNCEACSSDAKVYDTARIDAVLASVSESAEEGK